jgi:2-oxo-4-hydroxy-4-carboxy-5-ureidoimidazoline decarboxylase
VADKALTEAEFLRRYGGVYEHSAWIARAVFARSGGVAGSWEDLDAQFRAVIGEAGEQRQLDLLNAHPELACAPAEQAQLTAASKREQAGAGLDQCSPAEFEEFQRLNRRYRERFGFPFIMAVAGHERAAILAALRERLGRERPEEFGEALQQVFKIGRLRLREAWHEQH